MPRTTTIDNKPAFGKIIALELKKTGRTQRQFAQEIGISHVYLYRMISGRALPSLNMLKRLAKGLSLDVEDLTSALLRGSQEEYR